MFGISLTLSYAFVPLANFYLYPVIETKHNSGKLPKNLYSRDEIFMSQERNTNVNTENPS